MIPSREKYIDVYMEDGVRRIRANQGHTMKGFDDEELLEPILYSDTLVVCAIEHICNDGTRKARVTSMSESASRRKASARGAETTYISYHAKSVRQR